MRVDTLHLPSSLTSAQYVSSEPTSLERELQFVYLLFIFLSLQMRNNDGNESCARGRMSRVSFNGGRQIERRQQ